MEVILNAPPRNTNRMSSDVTSYNIRTGEHTSLPNLPNAMSTPGCTVFNDAITVGGGFNSNFDSIDPVWQLINNRWIGLPALKKAR